MDKLFKRLVDNINSGIEILNLIGAIQSVMKDSLDNSKGINTKLQGIDSTQEISVVYREYLVELLGYSDDKLVELDKFIKLYNDSSVDLLLLLLDKLKKEDQSLVVNALFENVEYKEWLSWSRHHFN